MIEERKDYTVRLYSYGTSREVPETFDLCLRGRAWQAVAFGKAELEWAAHDLRGDGPPVVEFARVLDEDGTCIACFQAALFDSGLATARREWEADPTSADEDMSLLPFFSSRVLTAPFL